ncbi:hypothetical protein NP493_473g02016 [Ridgeia piscesae]|uniref:Uncharacterized protein n=1 Tax=Ridgeia piscesae TaxID=27915 RepID=A0AAD9KYR3_RIDPI|nr:hypothetical protein NP493_473g02016 [Ridgeia piscesae]
MDSALAQWDENESSTPDKEWAALQQVKLLNVPGDIDHDHDNIPQRITKTNLDEIPTMTEMVRAIAGLKGDKAPGGGVRYSWEDLAMATTEDVWMPREVHNYDRGSTYWNDGESTSEALYQVMDALAMKHREGWRRLVHRSAVYARDFGTTNMSMRVKGKIYRAIVLSTFLYGAEA